MPSQNYVFLFDFPPIGTAGFKCFMQHFLKLIYVSRGTKIIFSILISVSTHTLFRMYILYLIPIQILYSCFHEWKCFFFSLLKSMCVQCQKHPQDGSAHILDYVYKSLLLSFTPKWWIVNFHFPAPGFYWSCNFLFIDFVKIILLTLSCDSYAVTELSDLKTCICCKVCCCF